MPKRRSKAGRPRGRFTLPNNGQKAVRMPREPQGPTILPATLEQRAKIVGEAQQNHQRAGFVLGQLALLGKITNRQFEAGRMVEDAWRKWSMLAGSPNRHPKAMNDEPRGRSNEPDGDAWHRAQARMEAIRTAIRNAVPAHRLAMGIIEDICVDNRLCPRLDPTWLGTDWQQGWAILRTSLDAVADLYRMPHGDGGPRRQMETAA